MHFSCLGVLHLIDEEKLGILMQSKLLISLDYELFFGSVAGTIENCLLAPTNAFIEIANRYNVSVVLFVDAGYLVKLQTESANHPSLGQEFDRVAEQLKLLKAQGHDIQLHIHPHWEDTTYDGNRWCIDTSRYKLHDFSVDDISSIVERYKAVLDGIVDGVFAFRAGGWCIQPFSAIADALYDNNVWLDSTVYSRGLSEDPQRSFDFVTAPNKSMWRFQDEPAREAEAGRFLEVPISACKMSPLFFWRMALIKKMGGALHKSFGDGQAMSYGAGYYFDRLFKPTSGVVSVDGLKSAFLKKAYKQHIANKGSIFNVMGHPKALSPYSLQQFDEFLSVYSTELESMTFQDFQRMKPEV